MAETFLNFCLGFMKWFVRVQHRTFAIVNRFAALMRKELGSGIRLPWRLSWRTWRQGFLRESHLLYALEVNRHDMYLSDYARFVRSPKINGAYSVIPDNKLMFSKILPAGIAPEVYCVTQKGGRLMPVSREHPVAQLEALVAVIQEQGAAVLKPIGGGGGARIHILKHTQGGLESNGKPMSEEALARLIAANPNFLVCEFIRQHEYARTICPYTTNTIRMLTMWDYEQNEPFLAAAVHRFGSRASQPVDNWTQGGISVHVDSEHGVLGRGASFVPADQRVVWHASHPETGATVEGVQIPNWTHVHETILMLAREVFMAAYLGWDVVISEDGPRVIEANNYTDVNLFQVHQPLLKQERVRRFYRHHDVIRAA